MSQRRAGYGGVILAGGQSSRMGQPKAWLELGGKTFLQRIAAALAEVVEPIVVVAAPDQTLPPIDVACSVTVVHDQIFHQGPLHGIARGLESLPRECPAAYVTSCDVPLLRPQWVAFLIDALGEHDIAVAVTEERPHPLSGVYRTRLAAAAHELISQERRRPVFLFETCSTHYVNEDQLRTVDPHLASLMNANTPDELEQLRLYYASNQVGFE